MSRKTTNRGKSANAGRKRWNEAAARVAVEQLNASGQTVAEYARSHGVKAWSLYEWRRRLGAKGAAAPAPSERAPDTAAPTRSAFLPVRVSVLQVPAVEASQPLEVVLTGGRMVRVPSNFDSAALRRLVSVLEEVC